jgi:hypothetical protein
MDADGGTSRRTRRLRIAPFALTLAALAVTASTPAAARAQGPPPAGGTVGYLGCSMTRDSVAAYRHMGGRRLWETIDYGGGGLARWENGKYHAPYWARFDAALAAHPETAEIWWQLCLNNETGDESDAVLYRLALSVLDQLRSRVGTMPVVVSPQPDYVPPHVCKLTGADGPRRMRELADRLAREGLVLRGPDFPALQPSQLRDRCHPNDEGAPLLGAVLAERFAGVTGPPGSDSAETGGRSRPGEQDEPAPKESAGSNRSTTATTAVVTGAVLAAVAGVGAAVLAWLRGRHR